MQSPAERHASKLAGYILSRGLCSISERDIYQNYKPLKGASRENLAAIQDAMRALELAGWARPGGNGIRENGRRVTSWAINPTVHTKFAARAKAERERREATRQERFACEADSTGSPAETKKPNSVRSNRFKAPRWLSRLGAGIFIENGSAARK